MTNFENVSSRVGYLELLRKNRDYRKFWIAQQISMGGDWVTVVALFGLVLSLTGSGLYVGLLIALTLLPYVLLSPFAGVLADRLDRKMIMVGSDAVRGFLMFGFLFIHKSSQLWFLYSLIMFMEVLGVLYFPASEATFPNLVEQNELYTANSLSGASWGTMLAVGSAIGGILSSLFGRNICFIADAVSFFLSAFITFSISRAFSKSRAVVEKTSGLQELKEGFNYARSHPRVWQLILFSGVLGLATGVVALYSIFPVQVFKVGDFGIGVLYSIRGIGALSGPLLARHFIEEDARSIWKGLLKASGFIGVFYLVLSKSPGLAWAAFAVLGAHIGNGAFWTLITFFFQKNIPDRFLGRVISFHIMFFTLAMSFSSLTCGYLSQGISPRWAAAIFGIVVLFFAFLWGLFTRKSFSKDSS